MKANIGDEFGCLTIQEFFVERRGKHYRKMANCICRCGRSKIVMVSSLISNDTKTCGQCKKERFGPHRKNLRNRWRLMLRRCNDQTYDEFGYYGGRGIKVCEEWLDFENFYDWALVNGFDQNLSIERKNTNGNYEPSNCKWGTDEEQSNNRRCNVNLTAFGETKTASQWGRDKRCKVNASSLRNRIGRGWNHFTAITTPPLDGKDRHKGQPNLL